MMAWALFCHDFDLSKGINILSEKCPVVLDHYTSGWIGFVIYLIVGIYLTKVYLPQLITFHPVWNTIDNLVDVKMKGIVFWPIFYLTLLSKLGFLHAMK